MNTAKKLVTVLKSGSLRLQPTTPWYLAGDIPAANVAGAYAAKGAASLAASYVNLANPGTNDLTTTSAPAWDAVNGWKFNGLTNYLETGITPLNNQTYSMIIVFTNGDVSADNRALAGSYNSETAQFDIYLSQSSTIKWANGGEYRSMPKVAQGSLAVAGGKAYSNGYYVADIPSGSGSITQSILLGAVKYNNAAVHNAIVYIQYAAVYQNTALTENQVLAVVNGL